MSDVKLVYTTDDKLKHMNMEVFDEAHGHEARIEHARRVTYLNKIKKRCPIKGIINVRKRRRKMATSTAEMKYNYERIIYLLRGNSCNISQIRTEMKSMFNTIIEETATRSIIYKIKKWAGIEVVTEKGKKGEKDTEYGISPDHSYDDVVKQYLIGCRKEIKGKHKLTSYNDVLKKHLELEKSKDDMKSKIGEVIKGQLGKIGIEVSGSIDINVNVNFNIK